MRNYLPRPSRAAGLAHSSGYCIVLTLCHFAAVASSSLGDSAIVFQETFWHNSCNAALVKIKRLGRNTP